VVRGGAWATTRHNLRSAGREKNIPGARPAHQGFRLARDLTT
jgi:formylglycine-generating enzyme required for sulfatase activity